SFSDNTTQVVTSQAAWQSSSPAVATVSSAGLVTAVSAGVADITATYQNVSGSARINIVRPAPVVFEVAGEVRDATSGGVLPNIVVQVVDGENAGKSARTAANGTYSLSALTPGSMTVNASGADYVTTSQSIVVNGNIRVDFVLPRAAPVCTFSGT